MIQLTEQQDREFNDFVTKLLTWIPIEQYPVTFESAEPWAILLGKKMEEVYNYIARSRPDDSHPRSEGNS